MAKKDKSNLNALVSDDLLESASGGYTHYDTTNKKWEVYSDTGYKIGSYTGVDEAMYSAGANHVSRKELSDSELAELQKSSGYNDYGYW